MNGIVNHSKLLTACVVHDLQALQAKGGCNYPALPYSMIADILASQPYFSAWVARMRVKYCGGGKSGKIRLVTLARFSYHYPKTR